MDRERFMAEMKARNIGTAIHYRAAHLYPYYRDRYGYQLGDLPRAETISERIVSLPLFPMMSDADQDRVIAAMADVFEKA